MNALHTLLRGGGRLVVQKYDGKCQKRKHSSPAKAKKFLKTAKGVKQRLAKEVYQCRLCSQWHLSTKGKVA